jgi:pimeloyl-ACP methyl ester carboxylesterase
VVLLEYRGYGVRPGKPGEEPFVADGVAAAREADRRWGQPVLLAGESLGAAVAAAVAAGAPELTAGLALITPWDSLADVARRHYRFVPVCLLRDRYDSVANLRAYRGPVAVVVAADDDIIPPPHAERLFASLAGTKRRWLLPGAGHNDWPDHPGREWWAEVTAFLVGSAAPSHRVPPAGGKP